MVFPFAAGLRGIPGRVKSTETKELKVLDGEIVVSNEISIK